MAETGLNKVAFDHISYVTSPETLLVDKGYGEVFGEDEKGDMIGRYADVEVFVAPENLYSTRKTYRAKSVGISEIRRYNGDIIEVTDTVWASFTPLGFEEFMYFTDDEKSSGPPNVDANGNVFFGSGDTLQGRIHTNGTINLSNFGCPTFEGPNLAITLGDENGGVNFGSCGEDVFIYDDENILDTIPTIEFPPLNTVALVKAGADYIFEADSKLFRGAKKDTMIMTEIEFKEMGFEVKQWGYVIPPISKPVIFDYLWDDFSVNQDVFPGGVHLFKGGPTGGNMHWDPDTGYGIPDLLMIHDSTALSGGYIYDFLQDSIEVGDIIRIKSTMFNKSMTLTLGVGFALSNDRHMFGITAFEFNFPDNIGFFPNEPVQIFLLNEKGELDAAVEFNDFAYYHDHPNSPEYFCRPDGFHHFDYLGYFVDTLVVMPPTSYQISNGRPTVIYIKGGQVLVKGVVDGKYTVVTDEFTEYRRHDKMNVIDRVWGNIWLTDDIVYIDSDPETGQVIQPVDGGTENVLGLVAGGNIIVANTPENGGRNSSYGQDIKINAAMIAMNEAFLSQYWQNTVLSGNCPKCSEPDTTDPYNSLGDGRGRFRNNPDPIPQIGFPISTGNVDYRGKIFVWGSIVQRKRGYIMR
ncbi:MAG: hypothetical protein HQ510_05470, partial [Candidatus Marinimicrobia bacterium]|nr:hypothetical protein [Candidatus Neomarinimicrobiota bacterium]